MFGVQITGSKPQVLVPAAEAIVRNADIDFLGSFSHTLSVPPSLSLLSFPFVWTLFSREIDVNCGCPIDLVFNKGAGSALLSHATKLGKSLIGMSQALGEIPLTIKIRTGITNKEPIAHKLMPRLQTEWVIQGITVNVFLTLYPDQVEKTDTTVSVSRCMVDHVNNVTRTWQITSVLTLSLSLIFLPNFSTH